MKQPWEVAHWLRATDYWLHNAIFTADWRDPQGTANAIRHYNDALGELVL
jgi:hypothetical protein